MPLPPWPVPSADRLSPRARAIVEQVDALADETGYETPEQHAQRLTDMRLLWEAAERGFERALAHTQGENQAAPRTGRGMTVRGIAQVTGANSRTVMGRIKAGREQIEQMGRRVRRRTTTSAG